LNALNKLISVKLFLISWKTKENSNLYLNALNKLITAKLFLVDWKRNIDLEKMILIKFKIAINFYSKIAIINAFEIVIYFLMVWLN